MVRRLGDVCYTGQIIDVYDNSKVVDSENGGTSIEFSPVRYSTDQGITAALNFVRTQPDLKPNYVTWQTERRMVANKLVPTSVISRDGISEQLGAPHTKNGAIVCGAISKSENLNKKLREIDRRVLAIETESGGIFERTLAKNVRSLTIRGISDYANRLKGELEKQSGSGVRRLAASNAASFLKLQMGNHYFISALQNKNKDQLVLIPVTKPTDILSETMQSLKKDIDLNLRALSPEFKLAPQGYQLPIPRIRKVETDSAIDIPHVFSPIDVREALALHDRVLINLPRTYPDQCMSWLLAADLLMAEIDQKQVVPIVVDGGAIKSKHKGLYAAAPIYLSQLKTLSGAQIVFIMDNIPLGSKHRLKLIADEVEAFPEAKFVFINRGDVNLVFESEFAIRTASEVHDICDISFAEIAHFVQKHFDMTGSEAQVIARRLCDTFSRFELSAHPSYFAGIPREILATLLQANRRSELIDLAVVGYLTYVVAGDKEDIKLSRSTRLRFLRHLIVEMKLEKRSFNQAELVTYTQKFADNQDFNINPLAFIQAFVDKGIMHFENGHARISLPFIESYLLAFELSSSPDKAAVYFHSSNLDFDLATFDLYAEIGASPDMVTQIVKGVESSIEALTPKEVRPNIYLTEEIAPSSIKRSGRAHALKKRLQKATEDVQNGMDDTRQKQKLIDLAEMVRTKTIQKSSRQSSQSGEDTFLVTKENSLNTGGRHWITAIILLGSGAEHLDATTKRKLSGMVIQLAACIIDEWGRQLAGFDFAKIKEELTRDISIGSFPGGNDNPDETKKLISGVVDILEFTILAEPLRCVIDHLCERARHRVLATSVEKAEVDGLMERVIFGTWLTDIGSERGRAILRSAIRALPAARFFRFALVSIYLSRVYWDHWQKKDRLILLNMAEEALKPLEIAFDKSKLKRFIERQSASIGKD